MRGSASAFTSQSVTVFRSVYNLKIRWRGPAYDEKGSTSGSEKLRNFGFHFL